MMNPTDPLSILRADHDKVKNMFNEYESMDFSDKRDHAKQITQDLAIHMAMEEKFFYPEIEKISSDAFAVIAKARNEHDEVKIHIGDISIAESEIELNSHMEMMKQEVLHHVADEEANIFKLAKANLQHKFVEMAGGMMVFKGKAKGEELVGELMAKVV